MPRYADHPTHVRTVLDAALAASEPGKAVIRAFLAEKGLPAKGTQCVLVSAGKASVAMARAAVEYCGLKPIASVVVVPAGSKVPSTVAGPGVRVMEADHPLPSQRNLIAAQAVLDAARIAANRSLPLVVMLSGGASAHLTFPDRGMTLSDMRLVTDALLRSGATIRELNTVRKHIERLKGGNLARAASPSHVFVFILADVLGEPPPLDVIASGPTAPDTTTFADALAVIEKREVTLPMSVMEHLRSGAKGKVAETLKQGDPALAKVHNIVVGSNTQAVLAAVDAAKSLGFNVAEARLNVEGEAREVGLDLARRVVSLRESGRPQAIIWGGETTVTVRGHGSGGRNQELALAAAIGIAGHPDVAIASFGTDGIDGVPSAGMPAVAGAMVTGDTGKQARASLLNLHAALDQNDSYSVLKSLNAHITTGITGTNVNDLMIGFVY